MGSLYAARSQDSGQGVTILARGQRFAEMRELNHRLAAITGHRSAEPSA